MNQRKAGAVLSYVGFLISNIVSLIYTPYMLQLMGQSEYGLYGTASSMTSYLSLLGFGIGGAYLRYNARCRAQHDIEEERRVNGSFLLIFSVLSVLVLLCGAGLLAFADNLVEETFTSQEIYRLRIIMALGIFNMALTFLFNTVMMAIQAYERYVFLQIVHLIAGIATPAINLLVLLNGGRAVALSVVSLSLSVACFLIYFVYAWKLLDFRITIRGIKLGFLKEIFVFSSFLFLNSITDQITNATDNVILGAVKGTVAVAIYTVGANFRNYFLSFSTAISNVFSTRVNLIATGNNSDAELSDLFKRVGRIQFYVLSLLLIGYIFIGHDFVCIWAGKDYSEAYTIGLLLMLSVFVPLFQNTGLEIQKAKNKHKARSIVYLLIAVVNVCVTIPVAKQFGGIGAAFVTMVCMIFGNGVFMNWYYAKHIGLDIAGFWKSICSILPGMILPVGVGIAINRFWNLDSYGDILLAIALMIGVYCLSVWLFSMNDYEKQLVAQPVKRILRRNK